MNFISLDGLSMLGKAAAVGAGAALVGALVIMYFLKLKRTRREIASTFLWKKSVEDMRANSPFQKLRRNLLLFLQLLILLAALFALARPSFMSGAGKGTTYIVLLDNSASMGATDVKPTRLAAAADEIRKVISDMASNDTMMIMTFAAHPRVIATPTGDRSALRAALSGVSPTDARTNIDEPLQLADALARNAADAQIVIASDGAFAQSPSIDAVAAPVRFVCVGRESFNMGITAMSIRRSVQDPTRGEIFANVANFAHEELSSVVSLHIGGQLVDATTARVPPGGSHAAVFKVRLDSAQVAEISLDIQDQLAADNRAWALLEPPAQVDVTIVGGASAFLKKALAAGGLFTVREAAAEPLASPSGSNLPVYVYDGHAPTSLARAGYLIFNAVAPAEGFSEVATVENPVVIDVDTSHPVTSLLDLGDLYIAKAKRMTFPPETKVLVNGDDMPLAALSYSGGARVVTVCFDPLESRWPLRISYPMSVTNAVNFLAGGAEALSSRQFAVGDVLVVPGEEGVESVTVRDPAGRATTLPYGAEGTVTYGDTSRAGVYRVTVGERSADYAANLADGGESSISPVGEFDIGREKLAAVAAPAKNRELWRELLVFAFVVLLVEWYIYNRRVFV